MKIDHSGDTIFIKAKSLSNNQEQNVNNSRINQEQNVNNSRINLKKGTFLGRDHNSNI